MRVLTATCANACALHGGECLTAWDDSDGCPRTSLIDCNIEYDDAVCECSHGCGTGPPCALALVCTLGVCM